MEIRILGPIDVQVAGRAVALGGPRQRTVLALLATHPSEVVSADRLIDDLWPGEPPETARKSLQVYVSRLRKLLAEGDGKLPLVTRAPGYALEVADDQLDALRFRRLASEGHRLVGGAPAEAAERLREALALWRGPALHDLSGEIALLPEIARLEEERVTALEDRIDADLALARHAELVGELDGLTRLFPLRERLTGQLMLALYRSGRQAEAVRVFQAARNRFVEELGLDPSAELQILEEQILNHDPRLDLAGPDVVRDRTGPVMRGYELRERLDADAWGERFVGYRTATATEVVVKIIDRRLADQPEFIRRFEHEAQRLARLAGPGVATLTDFWRDHDGAYLVYPRLGGPTLDQRMRDGMLSGVERAEAIHRISQVLRRAHEHGTVHGNLAASKIVLEPDGQVVVSDFGILHDLVLGAVPSPESDLAAVTAMMEERAAAGVGAAGGPGPPLGPASRGIVPDPPPTVDRNPYKGLRAFHETDADDFFGREEMVDRLVGLLSRPGPGGRIAALVGPSGSGKSSLVQAGLLPAVRGGRVPGSDRWFVVRLVPGDRPFEELEASLLRVAVNPPASLLDQLLDGELGIHRAVRRALPSDDSELLIVVDQFEELYTAARPEVADAFLEGLAAAVSARNGRLRLVLTVRSDFYDRPMMHPRFGELLRAATVVIDPMSTEGLDRAIVGPASGAGVRVEPTLVAEMLTEVAGRAGSLPLLQYALTELFESREDDTLSLARYREIGGVRGALGRRAEQLFEDLGDSRENAARQVFLRLVSLDENGEITRRRVTRSELSGLQLDRSAIDEVLERFGSARLLTFDRDRATRSPTVEVAHEALVDSWDRLRGWIEQAAADLAVHRRLAGLTRDWIGSDRADEYLLGGNRLDELEAWTRQSRVTLTEAERSFLAASASRAVSLERAETERLAHERDLERRSASRLRMLVVMMAVASAVALALTFVALDRGSAARRQGARAEAVGLSAAAVANADVDPQLALNLALRAVDVAVDAGMPVPSETESALHLALQEARIPYPSLEAPVTAVAAPGGTRGIFQLPVGDLVTLASASITRELTVEECRVYTGSDDCSWSTGLTGADGLVAEPRDPEGANPLAGTTVNVLSPHDGDLAEGIATAFRPFEQETGITVEFDSRPDGFHLTESLDEGSVPDLAMVSQPAWIPGLVESGDLVELGRYLDMDRFSADYGPYVRSLHSVGLDRSWPSPDGALYGVPMYITNKSLVWYRPAAFEEAGYTVPTTWGELIALSDRMAADGRVPWCAGEESGIADGWPATDWIESVLLGSAGPEVYDRWVRHEIPFDDPEVVDAAREVGRLYFTPGYVEGGVEEALEREFQVAGLPMFEATPGCWMYRYGSDLVHPPEIPSGTDTATFPIPSIDPAFSDVTMGGASTILAFTDRPEVREAVRYIASPNWGAEWAANPGLPAFSPANLRFDRAHFADPIHREQAARIHDALVADAFRFDASDLMPPEVGAGTFWSGMIDYLSSGPDSAEEVLAGIDASWPAR